MFRVLLTPRITPYPLRHGDGSGREIQGMPAHSQVSPHSKSQPAAEMFPVLS